MEKKLKSAIITGIGPDNYNFRKLENIAAGFELLGFEKIEILSNTEKLSGMSSDVALVESDIPISADLSGFKKVVVWQNWNPSRLLEFSSRAPDTHFVLAAKSAVHVAEFRERYRKTFDTDEYQRCDETRELIDLKEYKGINKPVQRITSNMTYAYAPLSTASDPRYAVAKDIDVVYFGTGANRPGVVEILRSLPPDLRIAAHFIENSGPVHPEVCVSLYRRAKVCLHEQVSPVWGEFAVRFGEASAQGCRIVSLAKEFSISDIVKDSLVPEHSSALSIEEAVVEILEWTKPKKEEREHMRKSTARGSDLLNRLLSNNLCQN